MCMNQPTTKVYAIAKLIQNSVDHNSDGNYISCNKREREVRLVNPIKT